MDITSAIVVYLLLWWWMFFMMLPIGVRPSVTVETGHEPGAPEKPHLWKKAVAATILAAVLLLVVHWIIEAELFSFRELAKEM